MTLEEFNTEFQFRYDAASNGGPDLNMYEKSLCLTQAVRDLIKDTYSTYETNERSRRILAPLLKEHSSTIIESPDAYTSFESYLISLPDDLNYIIREEARLNGCEYHPIIDTVDLDYLSNYLINPFRQPSRRRILKVEYSATQAKLYSVVNLTRYRIKYLKKYKPIILIDLTTDPTLMGDESIEGLTGPSETELPYFVHDEIIDRAVIIAIKTTRENNLQTQINT